MGSGAVTKSQQDRKVSVERKVGECFQWKAIGQCSTGNSCNSSHDRASGNRCGRDENTTTADTVYLDFVDNQYAHTSRGKHERERKVLSIPAQQGEMQM